MAVLLLSKLRDVIIFNLHVDLMLLNQDLLNFFGLMYVEAKDLRVTSKKNSGANQFVFVFLSI